jgi:hypothetical protein
MREAATMRVHRVIRSLTFWALGLPLFLSLLDAPPVSGIEIEIPFERRYETSYIVCIADAAQNELVVRHVWKGNVDKTLTLRWADCDPPRSFHVGRRYLVFAEYYKAHCFTREFSTAAADIIQLLRTKGPGKQVGDIPLADSFPSFRSVVRDLERGNSGVQEDALTTLTELEDSAGIAVPALERTLGSATAGIFRRRVCNVLGGWAPSNEDAKRALFAALEDQDRLLRLAAVEANGYKSFEELRAALALRLKDPDRDVREAARWRLNHM